MVYCLSIANCTHTVVNFFLILYFNQFIFVVYDFATNRGELKIINRPTLHGSEYKIACGVCVRTRALGPNISKTVEDRDSVVGSNATPIGNGIWRIDWSRDRWRHVTPKGQGRDPNMFGADYLKTAGDIHAKLWLHVTLKVMVMQIYLDRNILTNARDGIGQTPCSLNIIVLIINYWWSR